MLNTQPQGVVIKTDVPNKTTKDLGLASAMHCEGVRLLKVDKSDPRKQVFHFAGGELSERVERQWYDQTLVVCAPIYYSSLRMLKALLHNS